MESYICITQLNDFIFCPRSIYFHNIYQQSYGTESYHKTWQKKGQVAHKSIDEKTFSSKKNILQSMPVYCEKYNLYGVIDTFDTDSGELCERKYSVTRIYDGFRYQIYAQYFALTEMGYQVKSLKIYSKKSNQSYNIEIPTTEDEKEFAKIVQQMKEFNITSEFTQNPKKCVHCIYNMLCDIYSEIE